MPLSILEIKAQYPRLLRIMLKQMYVQMWMDPVVEEFFISTYKSPSVFIEALLDNHKKGNGTATEVILKSFRARHNRFVDDCTEKAIDDAVEATLQEIDENVRIRKECIN